LLPACSKSLWGTVSPIPVGNFFLNKIKLGARVEGYLPTHIHTFISVYVIYIYVI
jgi:hypothetical protein